jgi:hypothetical protein
MSIYFYASDGQQIKALCGVKVLIIPYDIAKKIKNKLDNIEQEKLSMEALEKEFEKSLAAELHSPELKEEYNHFKCLVHSRAASFFHMRNIMLRYCYSHRTRQIITDQTLHPHSTFREVLRYFIDYAYFHYAAFPLIEGHYQLFFEEKRKITDTILYPDRIRDTVKFLEKHTGNFNDEESSYRSVGSFVDRNFYLLLKLDINTFANQEYNRPIHGHDLKAGNLYFWLWFMFGRLLRRPALWGYIGHVVISKIKTVYPYILGRLFPGRIVKGNIGKLPAILCRNIGIDPVAFAYNKQSMKSPEKSYPSRLSGGLGNLLWHILSRCAVVASFMALDVAEGKIYNYFKKLRRFNGEWKAGAGEAQFEIARLDTEIIYRVTEQCQKKPRLSPLESIPFLETTALDIFKKYRDSNFFDFEDTSSPHGAAVNCAYMHI